MWINGELIEADVVEKQRAREIYETILRERRDPGLLEWTGGNIFKARVFPIEPHSEKRVKIVYTQVLPLRANRYRYSYGLRSEMLQTTPLRELSLSVLIDSALPLKSVHSPTHSVRKQQTEHSAKLEFVAQEYTPERDFEVVCEVDSDQADVVVVPHRRGDDGYFLVQLTPPTGAGNWQREIIPDGKPLELLLVCDTSASMDSVKRRQQEAFVASILASLGPTDRFNIAVCDVDSHWWKDEPLAASEESVHQARTWLADRISLGWTDLDGMVESLLPRVGDTTHVVYVGDGIVTANDTDPQAFANRLGQIADEKRSGTFHAVSVGNSYESTVLKAIAGVGGGSLRQIGGEQTPQQTAFELLNEIAQPALRELKVEFRGVQVAAVYPDVLPNLAAGTQQILVGRYLPQDENQSGEIVITGSRDGQPVRFSSQITLPDAEAGNSFIPRLWARAHLDHLLAQGSTQTVRDEIIAMSEEFHIITPYTSLLVLETDADRERFNVKRRYEMRDGERFFAEGRDDANYELLQQQMKRAADWRLELRHRVLLQLSQLGRQPELIQQHQQHSYASGGGYGGSLSMNETFRGTRGHWYLDQPFAESAAQSLGWDTFSRSARPYAMAGMGGGMGGGREAFERFDASGFWDGQQRFPADADKETAEPDFALAPNRPRGERASFAESSLAPASSPFMSGEELAQVKKRLPNNLSSIGGPFAPGGRLNKLGYGGGFGGRGYSEEYMRQPSSDVIGWINVLFPEIPTPAVAAEAVESAWAEEAVAVSQSLVQPLTLDGNAVEVVLQTELTDPVWERTTSISTQRQFYATDRWLHFNESPASPTLVHWLSNEQRGVYSRAFELGTVRPAETTDWKSFTPGQRAYSPGRLDMSYRGYEVEVERPADDRVVLLLDVQRPGAASQPDRLPMLRITVDSERHVVLEVVHSNGENVTSTTKYDEYQQVAGVWWPGTIETLDGKGRRISLTRQDVKTIDRDAFEQRFQEERPKDEATLVEMPLPSVPESEKAVQGAAGTLEHHLVLLLQEALIQQWDDAFAELQAIEQLHPNKPGLRWLRAAVLLAARRNEDARQLLEQQIDQLVDRDQSDELYLAGYILSQAQQIVDHNEMLRLLDGLRPVFEQQPEHAGALQSWKNRRLRALQGLGRADEVLTLSRELAESAPWDVSAQTTHVSKLRQSGFAEAAKEWLRTAIDREPERAPHETQQLRSTYTNLLREEGRVDELVAFLEEWLSEEPEQTQAYQEYLSALVLADRVGDADATAGRWLEESQTETELSNERLTRLNAAVSYALGQRYQIHMNDMDPQWYEPLRKTALFFLDHDHHFAVTTRIINDHRYRDTDAADRLFHEIAQRLQSNIETLSPSKIQTFVSWIVSRKDLTSEQWKQLATALRSRWESEQEDSTPQILGSALLQIYRTHFPDSLQLPLMRERIERAEASEQPRLAAALRLELFNELLSRKWNAEQEAEALALIEHLSAADRVPQRFVVQIQALHHFVDRMLLARYEADMEVLQDQGHLEELTRTELAAKQAESRRKAGEGVAEQLTKHLDRERVESAAPGDVVARQELDQWIRIERMYLDLKLDRNLEQIADELWDMLGDQPPVVEGTNDESVDSGDNAVDATARRVIEWQRLARAFAMMNYLAARPTAPEDLIERLEQYIAAGLDRKGDAAAPWKKARYTLLIALDRADDLERDLREWIRTDPFPAMWQRALARLVAERGEIKEAIALMEMVEKATQLSPADYATLADWYLASDQREPYKRAKIKAFQVWPEHQISTWLQQQRQPWNRSDLPLPSELDEEVLFAFQALFEKSSQPENYVYELRQFYTACRDFRLLQMLPDAVTGRTPQQVYSLLENLKSNLMQEIRNEATADEILQRLAGVRAQHESAIDLRALDLLEALVERQSSEVLNQPGPHVKAAVEALRRAFDHDWAEGEPRQMARLLDSLGTMRQQALREERLRQMRALHNMTKPGTDDRLFVGWHFAHALFYADGDREGGLTIAEIALREFEESHADGWPAHANEPLGGYAEMLESVKRFAAAERVLTTSLENPLNDSQRYWLLQRRDETWSDALREDGRVSLGSGESLYTNLQATLIKRIITVDDESHRQQTIQRLLGIYRLARDKRFNGYQEDLRKFAFELLPPLLEHQTNSYPNLIQSTADTVKELLGAREGLRFALDRYETYPPRFEHTWNNGPQQLLSRMASWRVELAGGLGDLEPRLLKIVLDELRRDLRTQQAQNRSFFHRGYGSSYYWQAKEPDFLRVAEEVLEERSDSSRATTYIAQYFYEGLHRYQRAIEILFIAHRKKLLNDAQQMVLVDFLHGRDRYAESIPILEPLVERELNTISYRTKLIRAYYKSDRPQQMRMLLASTDTHFRQQGRWTEPVLSEVAAICLEVEQYAQSAAYYEEVISLHQRTAPNRGIGNGTLSHYYSQQARAYSALGETEKAVDAAAAGIVSWGPTHDQRQGAVHALRQVLAAAKDLDAYVRSLGQQAEQTGQDSPLIRQQIGMVYAMRNEHQKAIEQFRIAAELQPNDLDTHRSLIASYKALGDQQSVIEQTLVMLDIDRHNLALYKDLAQQLRTDESLAERAATTLVEAAPHEAEHHQALAEFREAQGRWGDAINHWQHVAELRRMEPTGLLELAEAQIHQEQFDDAQRTLDKLNRTEWPERFDSVLRQVSSLQQRIPTPR